MFQSFPEGTVIIEGENGVIDKHGRIERGADKMCAYVAREMGFKVLPFPADWAHLGRAAGPMRNKQMLDVGKPDRVVAFHPDIKRSKGTADMIRQANRRGVPVQIFTGLEDFFQHDTDNPKCPWNSPISDADKAGLPCTCDEVCEKCDGDGSMSYQWAKEASVQTGGRKVPLSDGRKGWYYVTGQGKEIEFKTIGGPCSGCSGTGKRK